MTGELISKLQPHGCVLYFNFEEGSGNKVYDKSGYGNHGTIYGATWTWGKLGKALSFDGVDDYVEVPDSASLNPTEEITVMGWFYLKGPTGDIQNGVRKDDQYLIFWVSSRYTQVRVYIKRTDGVWKYLIIADPRDIEGKWVHVAMTYKSNGEFKGYLNGELAASTTLGALPIKVTTNPLQIGREPPGYFFNGLIDEVRIYNRALSENEIKMLYYNRIGAVPSRTI